MYRLKNSLNKCKYVCLILQVLIEETAPLKKKKKGAGFSDDLHHRVIIQLTSSLTELWLLVTILTDSTHSSPPDNADKLRGEAAFSVTIFACYVSLEPHTFPSTTAELIIISQRGLK